MSRLWKTIRHDSQTSTDFISNKRVDRQTFIRKDISGWDCEGDWVSERWLQYYVNKKLGAVKREVEVKSKKKGKLTIQGDEMCSFVGNKDTSSGFGWQLMHQPKKLQEYTLAKEIKLALKDYGILCHLFIVNVP